MTDYENQEVKGVDAVQKFFRVLFLIDYVLFKMYRLLHSKLLEFCFYCVIIYYFAIYLGLFVSVYTLFSDLFLSPFKFNFAFCILKILKCSPCSHQPLKETNFIS